MKIFKFLVHDNYQKFNYDKEKTKKSKPWFCELVTISQKNATDTSEAWSRVYPVYSIISTKFAVFSHISELTSFFMFD